MLVWKALVLIQKNTKLTQTVNRSPLGQKIPDLLLEQLKTTKPEKRHSSAIEGDQKPVHNDPMIIQEEHCVGGDTLGQLEHFRPYQRVPGVFHVELVVIIALIHHLVYHVPVDYWTSSIVSRCLVSASFLLI